MFAQLIRKMKFELVWDFKMCLIVDLPEHNGLNSRAIENKKIKIELHFFFMKKIKKSKFLIEMIAFVLLFERELIYRKVKYLFYCLVLELMVFLG